MENKDEAIQQFIELTAAEHDVAIFYLESAKWDIEAAITSFYGNDTDEHEDMDIETEINESSGNKGLNNLNVVISQNNPKPSKPEEKIVTLSSLKHNDSDDENEERGQAFYVGGSERGGGQQVLGPPRVNKKAQNMSKIQDLFKSAQDHGAEIINDECHESGASGSCKIFSGSGYRLGDENTQDIMVSRAGSSAVNKAANPVRVNVKIWSNGFSIDDGPLRSLTEPNDVSFLRALSNGQIPSELLQQHKYAKIDLNMEDRSSEEFKAPPKPKVVPFQGTGQMLGSPVPNIVNEPTFTPLVKATLSSIHVDESQPVTQLQIRLAHNAKLLVRMNNSHTVRDIRQYIISQYPQYQTVAFHLMTTFPNKILSDESATLESANLLNAVIVQRLI